MTTSNLPNSIDNAFMDRADIKQYIGPPPAEAIYAILRSCLLELMRVRMVETQILLPWSNIPSDDGLSHALALLAGRCKGFSGRTLRRLPVLAHAKIFTQSSTLEAMNVWQWLTGLEAAIDDTIKEEASHTTIPT
jgi:SpoVK/Ycf46/Vps4 family AAA+-type ATPase